VDEQYIFPTAGSFPDNKDLESLGGDDCGMDSVSGIVTIGPWVVVQKTELACYANQLLF
jgi:hypothetical protein